MNISFVLLICLGLFISHGNGEEAKPKVCLNMIVKNEKEVIERCLKSVLPVIDTWVIVDTGSTDGTQQIIRDFLKDIPGTLFERPWVNFGHNRNEALSLAKDKAEYVLFMDADDELVFSKNFVLPELTADFYYMPAGNKCSEFVLPRFIKTSLNWFWKGKIHEYVVASHETSGKLLEGVEYRYVNDGARSKDPETFKRDEKLLLESIQEEPNNPRNYYYLAMTYLRFKEYEKALAMHEIRANMPGWKEEAFVSKFYMGLIQFQLKKDLKTVRETFLDAYLFYPSRGEPLFYLIESYELEADFEKAYLISKIATELSLEKNGSVLVEAWIYEYGFLQKYALCAFKTGRYQETIQALDTLLAKTSLPEIVRQEMEQFYQKALDLKNKQTISLLRSLFVNL